MASSRISLQEVAQALGVSASTVSRALGGQAGVSEATRQRVRALARQLDYEPNHLAAALRRGAAHTLGVVVPRLDEPGCAAVVRGIELAASGAGFQVLLRQSEGNAAREQRNVAALLHGQVAGLLVVPAPGQPDVRHLAKLHSQGVPLVCLGSAPDGLPCPAVLHNDYQAAYQATEHLARQGCRRIAHLTGPQQLRVFRQRHQGYLAALADLDMLLDEELVFLCTTAEEAGQSTLKNILQCHTPPDGLVFSHDLPTSALLRTLWQLHAAGSRRTQVQVACFAHDASPSLCEAGLTLVSPSYEQLGKAAVEVFLELLQHRPVGTKQLLVSAGLLVALQ